ncbi:tetratricopeptide repeat-containing protein [Sphingomonas sp. GC_Shp_3]|uniref:ATP-grasp domain-containing protein n=1 Tax=Sphingomonas sp. GC_Shp_3 TaxID=2937383 RepID=UPI00226A6D70|nr:tetratricopeptide repeat-containing protein [Sphingomonas sp. GC_Shp_3]
MTDSDILGLHRILPMAFERQDMTALWADRAARVAADAGDAAAMMDLSMILQAHARTDEALAMMAEALKIRRNYRVVHGDGSGIRLLAFVTPGDFMANTPVDCLLNGSDAVLWLHYVDAETPDLDDLPEHDVALLAIGEATAHRPVLVRMAALLPGLPTPVLNADPHKIASLTRDGVSAMFADETALLVPRTHHVGRAALAAVAAGTVTLEATVAGLSFPIIIRPLGTHAGGGLDRADDSSELATYLGSYPDDAFFLAPFVDYRGADRLFGKQRIVLIGGKPYPSHLALSDHWIVHYFGSGMAENPAKRAIEAAWMANFDTDFAARHADAFAALNRHIGLDYFGIDCAELPDGRLLVFEVDVAMIVHDLDDVATFPYKKPAMQRLFDAFVAVAQARVAALANAA